MNNKVTTIDSFEVRDLRIEILQCEVDKDRFAYFAEIKLLPQDLLSEEESQSLVLDFRNLLRLETLAHKAIAAIEHNRAIKREELTDTTTDTETFGACPQCGQNDGYYNIHRAHWFVCHEHRVRWLRGENLFSTWRDENESDWNNNREIIGSYAVVPLG